MPNSRLKRAITDLNTVYDTGAEDLRALNDSILIGEPGTDLLTCIQEGRSIEAAIEDQSTIKSEGGQMSSRIPIRLRGETGRTEEGFFTEKNDLKSFDEKLWSMAGEYKAKYGERETFPIMSLDEYADIIAESIFILPEKTVLHRMTGDGPRNRLIAPYGVLIKIKNGY